MYQLFMAVVSFCSVFHIDFLHISAFLESVHVKEGYRVRLTAVKVSESWRYLPPGFTTQQLAGL